MITFALRNFHIKLVLIFLLAPKSGKYTQNKLKWAARTQIDLKILGGNNTEVDNNYFNDSISNRKSGEINRCESAFANYTTELKTNRQEDDEIKIGMDLLSFT